MPYERRSSLVPILRHLLALEYQCLRAVRRSELRLRYLLVNRAEANFSRRVRLQLYTQLLLRREQVMPLVDRFLNWLNPGDRNGKRD